MFKPVDEMLNKPKAPKIDVFDQNAKGEETSKQNGSFVKMPEGKFSSYKDGVEGGEVQRLSTPKFNF